jgi:hypothetical protein
MLDEAPTRGRLAPEGCAARGACTTGDDPHEPQEPPAGNPEREIDRCPATRFDRPLDPDR